MKKRHSCTPVNVVISITLEPSSHFSEYAMYFAKVIAGLSLLAGVQAHPHEARGENHRHPGHPIHSFSTSSASFTATPTPSSSVSHLKGAVSKVQADAASFWLEDIKHQGVAAFNPDPSGYKVFRNVKDYGAAGDGTTDDTAAINKAISDGGRFGPAGGETSTTTPAIVYFPAGTYLVSAPIIDYYFTQIIGNPNSIPVIKAASGFTGLGVIDGDQYQPSGNQGWTSTNVFYRQIRNLKIDLTGIGATTAATGIHWPVGQATSIQNVEIAMSSGAGTQHQGIFIENGSGGFLTDVTTTGGLYGLNIGSQQFTMRNLSISGAVTGISQIWNWGWTYQGVSISDCTTGFAFENGGAGAQTVGSAVVLDSTISGCKAAISSAWETSDSTNGSLILENVVLDNTPVAVNGSTGNTILEGGSTTIAAWGQGHKYTPNGPTSFQGTYTAPSRPSGLVASGSSNYYTKSKPQFETVALSSITSLRDAGAKGDGTTDDTSAIQDAVTKAASSGNVLFIDQGTYKVTSTLYFPPGLQVVGESYPVIMASGDAFSDVSNPTPVIQVGKPGDKGSIEWTDTIVSTQGSAPGAVLIEWNLAADSGAGVWDVHTRIGGFDGSSQQVSQCPKTAQPTQNCEVAYMSFHITSSASGAYLENVWLWTADHDIDDSNNTQISVFSGRGLLVEGSNTWLWGTAVEHHFLYQYNFAGASDIVAGFLQTETPYYMPNPDVNHGPFPSNASLKDPDYSKCLSGNCDSYGLRVLDGKSISIYGAGLYSFFNDYSTDCSAFPSPENCQSEIFSVEGTTSALNVFALNTVGVQNMILQDGTSLAKVSDNLGTFSSTIAYFSVE
ncbi:CAZyme family GH55 [Penicillium chermesinum]|uniref:CAZyme family GH55 n=1 Tax=Penicillium chermesinum TaxID=63820 RepID=A0A9W9TF11_9EURO|nr:CAZyme family GH55 [Penicillium chermesinum]KAJ5220442.1 CAZyme family GH55 [Penicillium chermesinum]